VIKDPQAAAEQALRMAQEGEVVSLAGKRVKVRTDTLCVHGDEATGVAVARAIRAGLEGAGIAVVPLTDMQL
jgi:UPF0271 protein